ncbi:MAG: LPS assembly lipoprotein LptE [Thiobacillaceae bacterium]
MKRRAFLLALITAIPFSGCGFQLRGASPLGFKSVYVEAPVTRYQRNVMAERMRTLLEAAGAAVTDSPDKAEIIFKLGAEKRTKTILSLTGAGRVAEYRLQMSLTYQAQTPAGKERLAETEIKFIRDMTYDDSLYTAKAAEEEFLYQRMDEDAAQQILRHLRHVTP